MLDSERKSYDGLILGKYSRYKKQLLIINEVQVRVTRH